MDSSRDQAAAHIDAHAHAIDHLHTTLSALAGADKAGLQAAVASYKAAHQQFRDDALECMN